ncbi:DUF3809 domain-containing protein [soil metagenome]|jgi:hypothetical protein|nr:DUF3809 domain-containing protein [Deinococcota bacterium]
MKVHHQLKTTLDLPLAPREALAFVQNVQVSLRRVRFMQGLRVVPAGDRGSRARVRANVPVVVPLIGPYQLEFESALESTPRGARLHALPPADGGKKGWAEVSGEAEVSPLPSGSRLAYALDITVHVTLPEPEGWGGRALLKMVEVTAQKVVADITQDFPEAVGKAALELERATRATLSSQ